MHSLSHTSSWLFYTCSYFFKLLVLFFSHSYAQMMTLFPILLRNLNTQMRTSVHSHYHIYLPTCISTHIFFFTSISMNDLPILLAKSSLPVNKTNVFSTIQKHHSKYSVFFIKFFFSSDIIHISIQIIISPIMHTHTQNLLTWFPFQLPCYISPFLYRKKLWKSCLYFLIILVLFSLESTPIGLSYITVHRNRSSLS